jgi:hypothetical protein
VGFPPSEHADCLRARSERAFSVAEVVIAVLLILVVESGMVLAMTSGSKLRDSARLQASLTTTGQRMIEDPTNNRGWMDTCVTPGTACPIARLYAKEEPRRLEDVDGCIEILAESNASPVDSPVDGLQENDEHGVVVDCYDIALVIQPSADVAASYRDSAEALTPPFTTSIDCDGNLLKGSLHVDGCLARNQVDERMTIDGCATAGVTNMTTGACPPSPPSPPASQASFYTDFQERSYGYLASLFGNPPPMYPTAFDWQVVKFAPADLDCFDDSGVTNTATAPGCVA